MRKTPSAAAKTIMPRTPTWVACTVIRTDLVGSAFPSRSCRLKVMAVDPDWATFTSRRTGTSGEPAAQGAKRYSTEMLG